MLGCISAPAAAGFEETCVEHVCESNICWSEALKEKLTIAGQWQYLGLHHTGTLHGAISNLHLQGFQSGGKHVDGSMGP